MKEYKDRDDRIFIFIESIYTCILYNVTIWHASSESCDSGLFVCVCVCLQIRVSTQQPN